MALVDIVMIYNRQDVLSILVELVGINCNDIYNRQDVLSILMALVDIVMTYTIDKMSYQY